MLDNENIFVYTNPQNVRESFSYLSKNGYGIDIRLFNPDWLRRAKVKQMGALGKALAKRGIAVVTHAPFSSLDIGSWDKHIRDYSLKTILFGLDLAAAVNSRLFVTHTGFLPETCRTDVNNWYKRFAQSYDTILTAAKKRAIPVAIENTWERETSLIRRIFRDFGKKGLRYCLDFGHANCFSEVPASEWLKTFKQYLTHLHIHDNRGEDDEHLALGKGNIDWNKNIRLLKKHKLQPTATFELERKQFTSSLRYLRNEIL